MGVVDHDADVVDGGGDHLETSRHVLELADTLLDGAEGQIECRRGRDCGEDVIGVRPADQLRSDLHGPARRPHVEREAVERIGDRARCDISRRIDRVAHGAGDRRGKLAAPPIVSIRHADRL